MQNGKPHFQGQGPGGADDLGEEMAGFIEFGGHLRGRESVPQGAELDLQEGQDLADIVMEVGGQAAALPFLGQGQLCGQGPEALLVGADLGVVFFPG